MEKFVPIIICVSSCFWFLKIAFLKFLSCLVLFDIILFDITDVFLHESINIHYPHLQYQSSDTNWEEGDTPSFPVPNVPNSLWNDKTPPSTPLQLFIYITT